MEVSKLYVTLEANTSSFKAAMGSAASSATAAFQPIIDSAARAAEAASAVDHALAGIHGPDLGKTTGSLDQATQAANGLHNALEHIGGGGVGAGAAGFDTLAAAGARARDEFGRFLPAASGAGSAAGSAGQAAGGAGSAFAAASAQVGVMTIALGTMAGSMAASVLEHIASAALDAGRSAIQLAGELEQSKVAFTTMLGSAQKADAFLRDLTNFAASTPFELKGLQDASKKLLAFGFDARDIIPIMRSVGDASAALGGGKAMIDGITMALGQMSAKGKVSAEEMNQLAERGVPAWKLVADAIGKDIPTAMKMAEKGAIDSSTAITALVTGMESKFGGLMDAQSKTFLGSMSNLSDGVEQLMTKIGTRIVDGFRLADVAAEAAIVVSNLGTMFDELMNSTFNQTVIPTFEQAKEAVMGIFTPEVTSLVLGFGAAVAMVVVPAIGAAMVEAVAAAGLALAGMLAAMWPIVATGALIAAAAYPIIKNWALISDLFSSVWSLAEATMLQWYQTVRTVAMNVMTAFSNAASWIADKFSQAFGSVGAFMSGLVSKLPEAAQGAIGSVASALSSFKSSVTASVGTIPGIVGGAVSAASGAVSGLVSQAAAGANGVVSSVMGTVNSMSAGASDFITRLTTQDSNALNELGKSAGLHLGKANKALDDHAKGHKAAADAAKKAAAQITKGFEDIGESIKALDIESKAKDFTQLEYATKYIQILDSALTSLAKKGVTEADARFVELKQNLMAAGIVMRELKADAEAFEVQVKAISKVIDAADKLAQAFDRLAVTQAIVGDGFSMAAEEAKLLERALTDFDLTPADEGFQAIIDKIKELKQQAAIEKTMKGVTTSFQEAADVAKNLGQAFDANATRADLAKKALADLGKQHVTTGAEVDRLKGIVHDSTTDLDRYRDASGKLQNALSGLTGALKTIANAMGAGFTTPLLDGVNNLGALATAVGSAGRGFNEAGTGITDFFANLQSVTPGIADFATHLDTTIPQAAQTFGTFLDGTVMPTLSNLGQAIAGGVNPALTGMGTAIANASAAGGVLGTVIGVISNPITLIGGAILGVVAAGTALINNWDAIKDMALNFFKGIADQASKAMGFVINNVHDAWERIQNFFTGGLHKMDLWVDKQAEMEFQAQKTTQAAVDQINAIVSLGQAIKGAFAGNAMKAFLDGSKTAGEALRSSVKDAILNGIVEAMAQKKVIESAFGGLFDSLGSSIVHGDTANVAAIVSQIGAKVPQVAAQMASILGPIKEALAGAFATPATEAMDKAIAAAGEAMRKQDFAANVLGQTKEQDLAARISIVQKALTDLNDAGAAGTDQFQTYRQELADFTTQLEAAKAAAKDDKSDNKAMASLADSAYGTAIAALQSKLAGYLDAGKGAGNADYDAAYAQLSKLQGDLTAAKAPKLAAGGVTTGPTMAMIGEGAYKEAVLPLSQATFSQIGASVARNLPGRQGGDTQVTITINHTGKGKWTRQDASELGDLMVGRLRALGIGG